MEQKESYQVEVKKKEPYRPRQCSAITADGRRCKLWSLLGEEESFCHYHHPDRAEQRRLMGVAVGKLPKIKMKDLEFKSLDDLIDFARKRMMLIATRSQKISPQEKERLLISWAAFLAPLLEKRDAILKRLDKLEGRSGRT